MSDVGGVDTSRASPDQANLQPQAAKLGLSTRAAD